MGTLLSRKNILMSWIVHLLAFTAVAQNFSERSEIRYIGQENGLSNNTVNSLYQDRYGFLWMGTYDGLNRYDGYAFKTFRHKWGDTCTLTDNHITALSGDTGSRIWIGTLNGLSCFDYSTSKISPVYFKASKALRKITASVNTISVNKNNEVFIATDEQGLFRLNHNSHIAIKVPLTRHSRYTVQALGTQDTYLWLFVKDYGLCMFDLKTSKIKLMNAELKSATCLLVHHDTLWIGTEKGLYLYHIGHETLNRFTGKLSSENVMSLMMSKTGKLWVGTNGNGVTIYDQKKDQTEFLLPGKERGGITSGAVGAIYEDKEARVWIATLRGGVNVMEVKASSFNTIKRDPFNKNSLVNNFALSFCEDEKRNIYIGTDGGGVSYWNPVTNQYENYTHHSEDKNSIVSNFVTGILRDHQNRIWMATFSGGIDRFDPTLKIFKHYSCYNSKKQTDEINVWKLYEDRENHLWAGTTRGGALYLYNGIKDRFELYDSELTNIHAIFQSTDHVLWMGDYENLIQVDLVHRTKKYYSVNSSVRAIQEGDKGFLWVGTEGGGLLHFNTRDGTSIRFTEKQGLPSNAILNVLKDGKGNLWCSTYNGLSKFDVRTKKFKNYSVANGLQSNQFNYNAALKLGSGEFLFGGIKGFNMFHPDSIKMDNGTPPLILTGFKINNVPIEEEPHFKDKSAINLHEIVIPYHKATISVDFVALEYSGQEQINYAYYMDGWDKDWNEVGKIRSAYYSRLDPGSYKLYIRSTNTDGLWNGNERVIHIVILPPWYRTCWAYIFYLLVVALGYYVYYVYRSRQRKLKNEIDLANLKIQQEKELNEKKISFFTNISHELRTPLTLIVNPIKDILHKGEHNEETDALNIVYRNSRRLLSLVDQLLLFRKTESENDTLNLSQINISKLAKDVFLCFTYLAVKKNIHYHLDCTDESIKACADKEKIEIVLFNLLSNALKFTPEGGEVGLSISCKNGTITMECWDNGPGISPTTGEKLFDKFYKIQQVNSSKIGFGIGLYLSRNFIELHQGNISYESEPNKGVRFVVHIPQVTSRLIDLTDEYKSETSLIGELMEDAEISVAVGDFRKEKKEDLGLLISDLHTMLIVDDNQEIIDYIKHIFKNKFKIYEANNGDDGLCIAQKFMPDIIISDVNMDGLNGIELCRSIKSNSTLNHIPVILLTANPELAGELAGIEVGAYDYVSKPFDKEVFIAKVNGVIKDRKDLQNYFYKEITLKADSLKISEQDSLFLQKCITIIEDNLTGTEFNVKILAHGLSMSHPSLYKKIKQASGMSISGFVRFIRLRKAAELLINTSLNINEVSIRVGLNDLKYFREQFQKQFKLTPSEFMKQHRKTFQKHHNLNYSTSVSV
ncbi:hybrid sensor histidine kinase/response regulator [Pedobacter sp. HMWF019]|uniref:hybrid sensor histidine kinase/response regulator transcription factor n=1 Tax=Pedobacter sp. HMWF019 TaxID=2056856 RepID=UPI000D3A5C5F|nr:hybrid sensor histidine kinase/response regulator [Pedobacter sp. HMWF019]PTS98015.1 hybrid sensor histidine kinase/response regulator [Pedobacter sp. HMWF019]